MKISISKIELTNFKCFRNKEITFDSDITTIRGRNGVGKTTIADAILWCLFGKNSQGQSDFDLKTHDESGKPIPNLDHSVEIELNVLNEKQLPNEGMIKNSLITSDYNITLKRTLKETWIKKRGSDEQVFKNNTTEYLVNGDSFTAADYKKFIANLIDESIFRAITNPNYFPSLKWQDQRQFLTAMVGEIEPEIIADTDELVDLVHQLDNSNEDIVSYRKHLSYQIKQVKDKLDKIPVRLEEQNKALPEKLDWDALEAELEKAQAELKVSNPTS
jgi:DNA repair exonuclease SbcCD ATPase subunit